MLGPIKFESVFTNIIIEVVPLLIKVGFVFVYDHESKMEHMGGNNAKFLCELINVYNTMYIVYLV